MGTGEGLKKQYIDVKLEGLADIMFDRFIDHKTDPRPPEQKLYLHDDNIVVMPADNIFGFLFNEKPQGCARYFGGKQGKKYTAVGQSHVYIEPMMIPFRDADGNPIQLRGKIEDDPRFYTYLRPTIVQKGSMTIRQEARPRPVLRLPWFLEFRILLLGNDVISPVQLENWFNDGGIVISLGTHRPRFGRFRVVSWDVEKPEQLAAVKVSRSKKS